MRRKIALFVEVKGQNNAIKAGKLFKVITKDQYYWNLNKKVIETKRLDIDRVIQ